MAYLPLTPEQYQAARKKFSHEQIVSMEQRRKSESSAPTMGPIRPTLPAAPAPVPEKTGGFLEGTKNFLGGAAYGFSAPGRTIQNTLSKGVDTLFGTKGFGAATKQGFQDATQTNLDTTAGTLGNIVGETATYLAAPGGLVGGAALKGLPLIPRVGARLATNALIGTAQSGDVKKGLETAAISEAIGGFTKPIAKAGSLIYKKLAIPTSAKEASLLQNYLAKNMLPKRIASSVAGNSKAPITADETALSKNLFGSPSMIGVQAKRAQAKVWDKTIKPALTSNPSKIDLPTFFDEARDNIIKSNPELSRQKSLLNALDAVREDYQGKPPITLEDLQNFKAGWAKFVPEKAYRGENIAGSFNEVKNNLASMARTKILSSINDPSVKRAYIDYGNLAGLSEWGKKAMTGAKFKGGTGGWLSAAKEALLTPIATTGGLVIYRTANGIEFVSAPGAKVVADLITGSSQTEQSPE